MKNTPIILAVAALLIIACVCSSTPTVVATTPTQPGPIATQVFDDVTNTPEPTATPVSQLGTTRDQPYPKNTTVEIGDGMRVTILEVTRPANDVVAQGNMFNATPVPNVEEYLMVKLHVECTKPSNEKCTFDHYGFKIVGANGQVHDPASVAGTPQEFEFFAEFFGGASLDGNIVYLVTPGDSSVVLFHEPLFIGDPIYIALQ